MSLEEFLVILIEPNSVQLLRYISFALIDSVTLEDCLLAVLRAWYVYF
jgi:hypothetical protein